jgi:hypothetical protein
MILLIAGFCLGYLTHMVWVYYSKRSTFVTTSYSTNSGRTATYVNYSFPNRKVKTWSSLFKKAENVFTRKTK